MPSHLLGSARHIYAHENARLAILLVGFRPRNVRKRRCTAASGGKAFVDVGHGIVGRFSADQVQRRDDEQLVLPNIKT